MDGLGPHRVKGDSGSRPNSPASVEGGQVSHAPSIREQGQAIESAMDVLQRYLKHYKEQPNQLQLLLSNQP